PTLGTCNRRQFQSRSGADITGKRQKAPACAAGALCRLSGVPPSETVTPLCLRIRGRGSCHFFLERFFFGGFLIFSITRSCCSEYPSGWSIACRILEMA